MSVLAGAAATSAVVVAATSPARADDWEEYLREDLGFRIEMPGEPAVDVKDDGFSDKTVRTIDAQLHNDEDDTRESALMINGVPAREFIRESDGINFVHRLLVVDRRTIGLSVYGDRDIHDSRDVQRFLRSFMLLGER
jgi:hypothetical protein